MYNSANDWSYSAIVLIRRYVSNVILSGSSKGASHACSSVSPLLQYWNRQISCWGL